MWIHCIWWNWWADRSLEFQHNGSRHHSVALSRQRPLHGPWQPQSYTCLRLFPRRTTTGFRGSSWDYQGLESEGWQVSEIDQHWAEQKPCRCHKCATQPLELESLRLMPRQVDQDLRTQEWHHAQAIIGMSWYLHPVVRFRKDQSRWWRTDHGRNDPIKWLWWSSRLMVDKSWYDWRKNSLHQRQEYAWALTSARNNDEPGSLEALETFRLLAEQLWGETQFRLHWVLSFTSSKECLLDTDWSKAANSNLDVLNPRR